MTFEVRQMDGFAQAKELVDHAAGQLDRIRTLYRECLDSKEIKTAFLIEIKNYMENLRSGPLYYVAHALFLKYGSSARADPKTYFPYSPLKQSAAEFRQNRRIDACIPGLTARRPTSRRRSSPTSTSARSATSCRSSWTWPMRNKHERLTPQVEKKMWGVGMTVTLPPGGTMEYPLHPAKLQEFVKAHSLPVTVCGGLEFTTTESAVDTTLIWSLELIRKIVDELSLM